MRIAIAILAASLAAGAATPDPITLPARFQAFAISGLGGGGNTSIDIVIERWSTAGELEQLASAFNDRGTDGLLRALGRLKRAGYWQVPGSTAFNAQFAQQTREPDGGGRILLMGERRLAFGEVAGMARSAEYPLNLIEMRINDDGEGSGTMWPAAKITYWDLSTRDVVIDNFTIMPVQLSAVHLVKRR